MGVAHVADSMQMTREETSELLENCNLRGIVRKKIEGGETLYSVTQFPRRLFHFVTFEKGWNEFPQHIRRILSEWMHRVYYYDRYRPTARKLKRGEPVSALPNEDILLLDEVLAHVVGLPDTLERVMIGNPVPRHDLFGTEFLVGDDLDMERVLDIL